MKTLLEPEKSELKLKLYNAIDGVICKYCEGNHNLGWISDNLTDLMAESALNVLLSSIDIQNYLKESGELR